MNFYPEANTIVFYFQHADKTGDGTAVDIPLAFLSLREPAESFCISDSRSCGFEHMESSAHDQQGFTSDFTSHCLYNHRSGPP